MIGPLVQFELWLAAATFVALRFVAAPYGRHVRPGWGPSLPARLGWVVMESPSVLFFAWVFARGPHRGDATALALAGLWELHYVQRTVVYPLRMRSGDRQMPVLIALLAISFNLLNSWNNASWIAGPGARGAAWLHGWRFLGGAALFLAGFAVNLDSDRILRDLRAPGEQGYRIPVGGLFRWVSAPNYLGEIVEWAGWALAAWSPAGLAFALYTVANLAPRAVQNHRWYRARFPDYPPERRALIPYVV